MGWTSLLFALLVSLPALSLGDPLYTLTGPNVFRIESEETVIVEAHNVNFDINVDVRLLIFPENTNLLCQTKMHLTSANNHIASATVKIPAEKLSKESRGSQYVSLEATSNYFNLQSVILITRQTGHIFIQTDKPIYTPSQTVLYRLLTVDSDLKPNRAPTIVEFVNPQDIVVERKEIIVKDSTGITGSIYNIPEIVNIGIWKIFASYKDAPDANFTTQFEVKEYVLPSFEVTLASQQPFFYVDDLELDVTVTARYTYGKNVEGRAFILFGILKDGERISIANSLQTVSITNGHGAAKLTRDQLTKSFDDINSLVGSSIYVTASVITHTGTDLVEAEKTGIKIVVSPYTILFTKTSKYYKPGMPFEMMVYVTNPDGSPANNVPVKVDDVSSKTHADGIAKLTINTQGEPNILRKQVLTEVPDTPSNRQASAWITAEPYRTQHGSINYLHISIPTTDLSPGEDLLVSLYPRNDNPQVQEQIKYFTYLLINKGKIVKFGRENRLPKQVMMTMQIPIKPNLIPSFRLVVYYYLVKGSVVEFVADSVWIDVRDTCMGTLKVSGANPGDDKKLYKPGDGFKLKITGDPGAKVGLVAVDKAVFALSKKNKITQSKVWNVVEKNDIGCSPGSGKNFLGVFSDAGLVFVASTNVKTETRTELKCQQPNTRRRRSTTLGTVKSQKLNKFTNLLLRRCCNAGMKDNNMGFSCSKRKRRITAGEACADAFAECCEHIHRYREQLDRSSMTLGRSADDDYYTPYEHITSRSNFPESWLWTMISLPNNQRDGLASSEIIQYLKDSITTWEIQAVSVSPTKGVCIAQPYELTVMKEFFIDLRLPYSAVRNEQVEIRAVLYNYHTSEIQVRVEFPYNENLCSNAKPTKRYSVKITIPEQSSAVVPYVVVPLTKGEIMIEVKASVMNVFVTDGVKKPLRVVPEGVKIELPPYNRYLEPKGKTQRFDVAIDVPNDMVPNTEPLTLISVQGDLLAETIENTIDAKKLNHLIRVPTGCGEQNMASMTPVLIVTVYLDKTNQWMKLGVDHRAKAVKNIQQGYTQELAYRKGDGSYAAFPHRSSSTWLTAYVVKVFAMAHNLITVEPHVLCGAVKWLILNKQKPDGHFHEDAKVIHGEMIGGIHGSQDYSPLTAFVLIAIVEAKTVCFHYVASYENSMKKAVNYLEQRIDGLDGAYGAVLSAYALSLSGVNKEDIVMKFASSDESYWPVSGNADSLYTIEATGYALLFFLQQKQYDRAGKLVRWLSSKSKYGGGYDSTQATIVALQALAKYMTDVPQYKAVDLDVRLFIPSRSRFVSWRFDTGNAYVARSLKLNSFERFAVNASGQGQGTLKVLTAYYALLPKERQECKNFNLDIEVENIQAAKRPEDAQNTLLIKICARYHGSKESSMVILDISMLTGFSPDVNDLGQLKNGIEDYISRYEIDKALSTRGSLIIYLDSVSNLEDTCVAFKVHQFYKVGLIQPASVKIYEYYDTTKSCTRFYNVPGNSEMLSKICQGDVCKCAEGSCVTIKTEKEDPDKRDEVSCAPGTDYIYKVKFLDKKRRDNYVFYNIQIQTLIKQGSDPVAEEDTRKLIIHFSCDNTFHVELNKDYLIMGQSSDLWQEEDRVNYLVGESTWMEKWPNDAECQERKYRQLCQDLEFFSENLRFHGCPY
ncbi:complement C3-like [Hypanus sabinus]|uniref:complement C3-like n=1 Tax=Hypanus sabinus TaxID=79690 RepID=UPI0028C49003|nr:complement C3-like [Hypanus sabinus]